MNRFLFAATIVASVFAGGIRAADAKRPVTEIIRIPIECEDMRGVQWGPEGFTPTWTAGRWGRDLHQNMVFGGVWASRMAAAVCDASATPSEVYQDVVIPERGKYKIWAKYECPPFFSYPFGIRVQPLDAGGKPQAPVFEKVYGLRPALKHFSFLKELRKGDLYWTWGMDHDAAEGYEADLGEGRVRVTLYKAAAPAGEPVGARSVDAILITSRISELSSPDFPRFPLLDELQQANHLYVRFRNTGKEPIIVSWDHWNHRANHYYTADPRLRALVKFHDSDAEELPQPRATKAAPRDGQWHDPIKAGGASPWIDIGPTVSPENSCPFTADAFRPGKPRGPATDLTFAMDIATEPRETAIVKSFEKGAREPQLALLIQPDLHRPEGKDWTLTVAGVYRRMSQQLASYTRIGPVPKKLRLYGGIGFAYSGPALTPDRPDLPVCFDYAMALGLNTLPVSPTDANLPIVEAAEKYYASKNHQLIGPSGVYHHTQDLEQLEKSHADPKSKSNLYYNSFGDEIGLPAVNVKDAKLLAEFHEFLRERGVNPEDLGAKTMDEIKPLPAYSAAVAVQIGVLPAAPAGTVPKLPEGDAGKYLKRLYWHSNQFTIAKGIRHFAQRTEEMTRLIGPHFKTSANLGGMHPFYWMHQASFIDSFKGGAMTLAWSEDYDYCQPEVSRLVIDFLAAYLRAGAKYHDTPMMFYCMPHYPGNTGQHVVQNAVILWGQGVRDLDFFGVSPDAFNTENYIHSRGGVAETGRGIRQISGMAGNVENELLASRTKKARVAILLSEASDVWEVQAQGQWSVEPGSLATNVSQEERKNIWYCLRNHGYLVDLLTENDVADGWLKDYSALYVCGRNLDSRTADPIRKWVEAGGRVYLTAGAARRDQYDESFTGLDAIVGRGAPVAGGESYRGPLRAKLELLQIPTLDHVEVADGEKTLKFDALASREDVAAADSATQIIGHYSSGKPALLRHPAGKGSAYYIGTLPGQAYVRQGLLPARPMGKGGPESNFSQWEPLDYDPAAAGAILLPITEQRLVPDAVTNHRGVVANVSTSRTATIITVINLAKLTDGKIADVEITLDSLRPVKSVRTAMKAKVEVEGGKAMIRMKELDEADVIVIQHE